VTAKNSIWLLGPQYHAPFLGEFFSSLDLPGGPIAVVTAGWQEREGEDDEIDRYLDGRSVDLELYRRADVVFQSDPELRQAHGEMQRQLRELERLYDKRLAFSRDMILSLLKDEGDPDLLGRERDHAMAQLRDLDEWHLKRIIEIRGAYEKEWKPHEREIVAKEREAIAELLKDAPALVIAGGHVAVLLNRLRLFGVDELAAGRTMIAWSAGAMTLTDRVVLFHDHPPQGPGNAEVVEQGFGLCPRLVALPDGRKRLDLEDPHRVIALSQRFAPDACIVMGDGDAMCWDGDGWTVRGKVSRLSLDGTVEEVSSW
jgi:hypothetical protein